MPPLHHSFLCLCMHDGCMAEWGDSDKEERESIYLTIASGIQETEGVSIGPPVPCQRTILLKINGFDEARLMCAGIRKKKRANSKEGRHGIQEKYEEGRDVMLHYYTYGTYILFCFCYLAHSVCLIVDSHSGEC